MAQINNNSRDAALYADEANYLQDKGKYKEALTILEKAEAPGCANEYTESLKAKINKLLEKKDG